MTDEAPRRATLPEKRPHGSWVQTERAAHEAWAMFLGEPGSLNASRILHLLISRMGDHNAVVMSQKTMAGMLGIDTRTVRRAVAMLKEHRWIETRQIGDRGTVNAYVINDRVAWSGPRDGIRYSLFTARIVISDAEQPDREQIGREEPLHKLPSLYPDEQQLPAGRGLPPESQPSFDGMELPLPSTLKR